MVGLSTMGGESVDGWAESPFRPPLRLNSWTERQNGGAVHRGGANPWTEAPKHRAVHRRAPIRGRKGEMAGLSTREVESVDRRAKWRDCPPGRPNPWTEGRNGGAVHREGTICGGMGESGAGYWYRWRLMVPLAVRSKGTSTSSTRKIWLKLGRCLLAWLRISHMRSSRRSSWMSAMRSARG